MIATSTHDTKRGEDARARLNVLSEMPAQWQRAVSEWRTTNAPHRTAVDRKSAPDPNDEYLFYQALVGSWPAERRRAPIPAEAPAAFVARLQAYMQKAIKEAKTHTSWFNQNAAYEDAVSRFVETDADGPAAPAFLAAFVPFVRRRRGRRHAELAGAAGVENRRRPASPTSTRVPKRGSWTWPTPTTAGRSISLHAQRCSTS